MLITLVRDSVLQCFCHSCKAPLSLVVLIIVFSKLEKAMIEFSFERKVFVWFKGEPFDNRTLLFLHPSPPPPSPLHQGFILAIDY
ncbi:hypothetical protein TSAR_006417 [Trichomalopsis sarcophagae]|uniref:Uncharacterized protein n=1 Tax=Trichomalopsis sarcophagae TaxID=543379 RepID=A0A232FC09_9HYME|nr:hypothetical protein TSAR_006417 [Trichomalopsis sarcophagae]